MLTAKALSEAIDDLRNEVDAIVALATEEKRELSSDEQTRVNAVIEKELPEAESRLENRIKLDNVIKQRAAARLTEQIDRQQADDDQEAAPRASIKVPATAKVHRQLQAFQGSDAERDAYVSGHAILAGILRNERSANWCREHGLHINAALSTGTNSAGGFLVPEEMQRTLIRLREERGVFPRYANSVPMGSDIITVPRLLADVTAYWTGEASEITASDVTLGSAELMARKLACLTKVSTELDEDAIIDIGDMVTQSMAYAMADKIDEAGFNGDGTSSYGGVLGLKNALHANAIQDAASGNTSALTLDLADFEACVGKYPQYPGASPRWFMHSAVFWASAARLADAAGGNTSQNIAGGPSQSMFLGYPVTFTQVLPSTTGSSVSTILAYFGDLRLGCTVGTRRSVRTEVSTERYFENDQIGIKCTERIAINVHERGSTIRTRPVVALKTAAS